MGGNDGHCVQRVQFAIAPPHLVFPALLFRHVDQEALVALDFSGLVPRGEAAFRRREMGSVFAAKRHFKIAHMIVQVDLGAEGRALLRRHVHFVTDVERHQLLARFVPQHLDKRVVAIKELALGRGHEHSLLHLLEQQPVALFRAAPVSSVANHVNGALVLATLLCVGGGRDHRIPAPFHEIHISASAVRALRPLRKQVR